MTVTYQEFFKAFGYSPKDEIYLRRFHDKDKKLPSANMSCEFAHLESLVKSMKSYNENGYGIFYVVNGGGHNDKSVKIARAQFIDMDDFSFEEQWNRVNSFPLEPSIIIKTQKSLHCYWLLKSGNIQLFENIQKRLIQRFGSDPTIKNPSRVMRLPGFYHQKKEPVMVEIVRFNPEVKYSQNELIEVLPELKNNKNSYSKMQESCKSFKQGNRTQELVSYIGTLQNKGYTDDFIIESIRDLNSKVCEPPLTDDELEKEVFPSLKRWEKGKAVLDNGRVRVTKNAPTDFHLDNAEDVEIKDPEWLIAGYIPKNGITTIAGEGGVGKTSIWCSIVASITTGKPHFLLGGCPFNSDPADVVVFSAEDSWNYVLKQRLISNGADMKRIKYMGAEDERFAELNFNSELLKGIIETYKPALVVFDPVQAFVPEHLRMGDRNAMRKCFAPLIGYGEKYNTTFVIICHANKQNGVWGRKRMADSSDIWDASRSVLLTGTVPNSEGLRYITHEKSNWGKMQNSVIFELQDCAPVFKSYTNKKDRDFVMEDSKIKQSNSKASDFAKDYIMNTLEEHKQMEVSELDDLAAACGISKNALKEAKTELTKEKLIHTWSIGYGKDKKYYITLKATENINE